MKTANIIVLAGQSNAVGVGYVKYLKTHFTPEKAAEFLRGYANIQINYYSHDIRSEGFVATEVGCAERTKYTFGPEIGIAEQMTERYPDADIFLVKCAVGGTSMHTHWRAEGGELYRELIALLTDSIRILEEKGYRPQIRAFCFMQGESDADTEAHAAQYISLYDGMLRDFRASFAPYLARCVYIDGGISTVWKYYREINESKAAYAVSHENCCYLDTLAQGLTTANEPEEAPDIYHYDSDSMIRLGRMFAERIVL